MATITFDVNTLRLRAKIEGIQGLIKETLWHNAVGEEHAQWMSQNIQAAGIGTRWATMSANTRAARPSRRSAKHFSTAFEQRLVRGIFKRVAGKSVSVGINAKHADLHHFGTGRHEVTPRRAGTLLRFKVVGGIAFARRVNHPGFPARRMLPSKQRARQLSLAAIEKFLVQIRQKGNS